MNKLFFSRPEPILLDYLFICNLLINEKRYMPIFRKYKTIFLIEFLCLRWVYPSFQRMTFIQWTSTSVLKSY